MNETLEPSGISVAASASAALQPRNDGNSNALALPALLEQVSLLPPLPGVYRYFDADAQLLYVGKARDLKKRVASYFNRPHEGTRIGHMVRKIVRLETTVVRSEAEALLLENNLIKTQNPRYNILFRDDKSYPYVRFTAHAFPRVAYFRGTVDKKGGQYFGPYPNGWAVKESIQLVQKVFQLRNCEDAVYQHRSRPCLMYQIKRCSGPCVGLVSAEDYAASIASAAAVLRGKSQDVIDDLAQRMNTHAERLEYEQAAQMRNKMQALAAVMQTQSIDTEEAKDVDIIAVAVQGGRACVNVAMVRSGRHLGDRAHFPQHVGSALDEDWGDELEGELQGEAGGELQDKLQGELQGKTAIAPDEPASLEALVLQRFLEQHYAERSLPDVLILGSQVPTRLPQLLAQMQGKKLQVLYTPREKRRDWLTMAQQGAQLQLARLMAEEGSAKARTRAVAQAFGLEQLSEMGEVGASSEAVQNLPPLDNAAASAPALPTEKLHDPLAALRIECFDISHTAGEATQASCVVFENHALQSKQYRRYNIEGITPGDDYAAMRQVLMRRYKGFAAKNQPKQATPLDATRESMQPDLQSEADKPSLMTQPFPHIVLVDGGVGQVNIARAVFTELGLDLSALVGIEKGEKRKVGLEEFVFGDGREKVYLGKDSPALLLLAQVRDEAHRFAITGMRAKRAKVRTGSSQLEDIPGVGPKRRAALLKRFGGVAALRNASMADIAMTEGVSTELAQAVYDFFR